MSAPLVRPYITYEELCQLPSDGNRYELFDGEAHSTPAPTFRHQKILMRLSSAFEAAVRDGSEVVLAPFDVVLAPATAVQPDLVFICERNLGIVKDAAHGSPDLVVEVLSPSTSALDRGLKMETYALHGIGEYWIADIDQQAIEIYRLDREAGAYRLEATCRAGDRATTPLLPELAIDPEGDLQGDLSTDRVDILRPHRELTNPDPRTCGPAPARHA